MWPLQDSTVEMFAPSSAAWVSAKWRSWCRVERLAALLKPGGRLVVAEGGLRQRCLLWNRALTDAGLVDVSAFSYLVDPAP
ncbi:MAG: hypothetical protein ACRDTA_21305, partial [Pseudonocardiaceae bacterium]